MKRLFHSKTAKSLNALLITLYLYMCIVNIKKSFQSSFHVTISPNKKAFPKCPLCQFKVRNCKENSGPNDFVLTFQGGNPKDIFPFFRTLRTTGCAARLIFFCSDLLIPMVREQSFFQDCGIETIEVDIKKPENCTFFYHHYRFTLFFEFLMKHNECERAFITDMDAFFQGDPFTTEISKTNSIYFLEQYVSYSDSQIDCQWARAFYRKERGDIPLELYQDRFVVNCGSIIGSRNAMILCSKAFMERSIESNVSCTMGEQGIAANIVHNGELEKQGIHVHFLNSGQSRYGFGLNILNMLSKTSIGEISPPGNKSSFYLYFHAFAVNYHVKKSVQEACPSTCIYDFIRE